MSGIKVKCIGVVHDREFERNNEFEKEINEFLSNNNIEIIDIKYSANMTGDWGETMLTSCLIIYKEK